MSTAVGRRSTDGDLLTPSLVLCRWSSMLNAFVFEDTVLGTAFALSVVAGLCSAAGGLVAVLLEGPRIPLQRVALWHAAMGAALLFLGLCDILPEAAAGLSAVRVSAFFALGASASICLSYLLGAVHGQHVGTSLRARTIQVLLRLLRLPRRMSDETLGNANRLVSEAHQQRQVNLRRRNAHELGTNYSGILGRWRTQSSGQENLQSMLEEQVSQADEDHVLSSETSMFQSTSRGNADATDCRDVLAVGLTIFFSLSAHNLLEGMSILLAAHDGLERGVRLAAAVSLENFPEGMVIALPIMYATGCPVTAVRLALCSGMVEPVGVLVLGVLLRPCMSQPFVSSLLATIAGIFASLSIVVILPLAVKTSNLQNNRELNKWIAFGMISATLFQPLLIYHGRVGSVE